MEKTNIRYGVVNEVARIKYEKKKWNRFNHEFITRSQHKAIVACKKKNNPNYIVEMIYDTPNIKNFREEIYRSGSYEQWEKGECEKQ